MYYIIVNPASKSGKGKLIWTNLETILTDKSVEYKVFFSKNAGHVSKLVRDICESTLSGNPDVPIDLIVLGGDGTLNEALQGITDFSKVRVGYIPTGSSNDFARDLSYSKEPEICLENILNCQNPTKMDIGCLEYNNTSDTLSRSHSDELLVKRYFNVSAGIGYDAAICEEALTSKIKKFLNKFGLGKLVYLVIALKQLLKTKNGDCVMTLDDNPGIKLSNFLFVACMIHQYEGGGFKFCPNADYTDGIIDICGVSDISKFTVLRALPKAMKGKHFKYKGIERYSAKKIKIETSTPLWVHTDGEVSYRSSSITITCLNQALQVLK